MVYADGNGFKTSTMRLGADVIVFSRCEGRDGKGFVLIQYSFFNSPFTCELKLLYLHPWSCLRFIFQY